MSEPREHEGAGQSGYGSGRDPDEQDYGRESPRGGRPRDISREGVGYGGYGPDEKYGGARTGYGRKR
jgi:hypothetical protein